jgi:ABC-2 type transport system permease protein
VSATDTGAVYDRGYRPYDGPRGGRSAARSALLRLSVRRALGLRRSWRQKVFPWTLLGVACIPAVVNVGVKYLTRDTPVSDFDFITYREYVGVSTTLLLFVALTAPDIICPDRRNRVLPLIFARPLTGGDYVLAKVGAMAGIVFGFSFIPHVVLFVGQMLVVKDGALDYFRENAEVLWQVPVAVFLFALYWGALGCALAATTERRVVGGVILLGLVFVTQSVTATLVFVNAGGPDEVLYNNGSVAGAFSVLVLPLHIRDLVFLGHTDPEGFLGGVAGGGAIAIAVYVLVVGASLSFLLRRYREVS